MNEVSWHKKCLKNMKSSLIRRVNELEDVKRKAKILKEEIDFYEYQIEEAEKMGKEKFDEERFRVKRR